MRISRRDRFVAVVVHSVARHLKKRHPQECISPEAVSTQCVQSGLDLRLVLVKRVPYFSVHKPRCSSKQSRLLEGTSVSVLVSPRRGAGRPISIAVGGQERESGVEDRGDKRKRGLSTPPPSPGRSPPYGIASLRADPLPSGQC